jgi:predicted XRE-type DNA-binding protein
MWNRKLSRGSVIEIKRALMAGAVQSELAERYGVSKPRISAIATGRCYVDADVEGFDEWRVGDRERPGEVVARRIMDYLVEGELSQCQIARRCGCAQSTVSEISRLRRWTYIDHPWTAWLNQKDTQC